jgi:hypothetical protein
MRWPRELALACLLGSVLCSCHDGTRTHLTAGGVTSRNLECNDGAVVSDPVLTADCIALAR